MDPHSPAIDDEPRPGFRLVELVVTAIAVVAIVAVIAVSIRGITSASASEPCAKDAKDIEAALDGYRSVNPHYADEAALVTAGFIPTESKLHDIELADNRLGYRLVGTGECATPPLPTTTVAGNGSTSR